ncbi:MAG TPA: flap endonuclease-1 [Thermoplasmatales archaeon]|nr:flap endonuclease-1 [Thermoplasmatales archaeon]
MGVDLKPLIVAKQISLHDLKGKVVAIDAYNAMHQFLSIIRQRDGTPLKDSKGRITSHLSGLLYRTANLVEEGIKPVYVFDGKPHPLKLKTLEERKAVREEAKEEWIKALEAGDLEEAFKKAVRTSSIDKEKVEEAKKLLDALGIPYVDAKSEGEAQAAYMNARGDVDMVASQDYDALLFGSPLLVRNLAITGKRKLPDKQIYVEVVPEEVELQKVLEKNGITREQLVDIAILIGTDFNEGIKGIGPKKALQLIKEYKSIERLVEMKKIPEIENYEEIRKIFLEPEVNENYKLEWREVDENKVIDLLCNEHQFSEDRVRNALEKYKKFAKSFKQKSLFDFG